MEKQTVDRLTYLKEKRQWLLDKGQDLRPNRLKEMIELMELSSETPETDEHTTTK